jgi:glycosyltransferase involved in cell wall biosynthesis
MEKAPDFTIITPSRNMLGCLKACVASVRDQSGVTLEHRIIDAVSSDGSVEWLEQQKDLQWISEPDHGMYDALNKGLEQGKGEYFAYLNCDEQYLAGALETVKNYFLQNPNVDAAFAHIFLVNAGGEPLAFRKACPVRAFHIRADHLYNLSCGFFFRRQIIDEGFRFDDSYRCAGDADFILRALKKGCRFGIVPAFTSLFQMTGANLGASAEANAELKRLRQSYQTDNRMIYAISKGLRLVEKLCCGGYRYDGPSSYQIYNETGDKTSFKIQSLSYKWPK